jgi:uncharacterized damage-inducible protein DinB
MLGYALDSTSTAADALTRSLEELADLLATISDEAYVWKPDDAVSGAIGAHVRHVLDHVVVLVDRRAGGAITYDRRVRDTSIERNRAVGIAALRRTAAQMRDAQNRPRDEMLVLEALVERGGPPIAVTTSFARELVFALQHTIHHQAIVAVLLRELGISAPAQFGYAPSTPVGR